MVKFIKLYDFVMEDERLDLKEAVLLCLYINKFILNKGCVIASDTKDAEYLKTERHSIAKRRKHLEELKIIKCIKYKSENKENPFNILIDKELLKKLEIEIK